MTRLLVVCVIACALVSARLDSSAAQTARLKYIASVYSDSTGAGLRLPEGVACGAGEIVVGDTGNDRLLRFTVEDKVVTGGTEIRTPELSAPSRVHMNANGEIFALDLTRRRVVRFGPDGAFQGAVGFAGAPGASTILVKDFALDAQDNLYVLDAFSARVLVVSAQAGVHRTLTIPPEVAFASSLAVDASGTVFLLDSVGRRMFSAEGGAGVLSPLGGDLAAVLATMPASLIVSKGLILVAEGAGSSIVGFGRDGTFLARQLARGWNDSSLNYPSQMCINERDELFIADRDNSRIQVFQLMR